jgi:DNA polymerase III epsilon subunit-like protein
MLNQGNKRGKETQVLALDCERVKTNKGERLARVSIVNFYGNIVFDTLVKPCNHYAEEIEVEDYREQITGIKAIDLDNAPTFKNIEPIIQKIVKNKTIVGHSLTDDFEILKIDTKE